MQVISIRVDDDVKRKMGRLSYINWSEVIRSAIAQKITEEERKQRRLDPEALMRAKESTDALRRLAPGWSSVQEIRKWRELRRS